MRRFYALSIQPTLFGGASVVRNWGRIGARGQCKVETFDIPHQADTELERIERIERMKRRKGYVGPADSR